MKYCIIPQAPYTSVYYRGIHTMGFSAKFITVLDNLLRMECMSESEKEEFVPFIDWETRKSSLFDESNKEIKNEWEYCFDNLVSKEDLNLHENYMSNGEFAGLSTEIGQYPPKTQIKLQDKIFKDKNLVTEINKIISKYIRVKKSLTDDLLIRNENEKILAVHCRRSEMHLGHPNIALNYENETYFEKVMKIFESQNFDKIYLASEETELINFFVEKLGDRIIFQDCYRIGRTESPFQASWAGDPRPNHFTLHAQEVMKDILNMSKCDSLICGISGVSNLAIYFNGLNYNDVYYFDEI